MKIGIITLPLHANYGGILQAYALQTVLERMGHKVEVIDRNLDVKRSLWRWIWIYSKRLIKIFILKNKNIELFVERRRREERPIIEQNTRAFINKYIHIRTIEKYTEVKESDYDAIVVGSDQVWRPIYFGEGIIQHAYLDFAKNWKNLIRISYAASFGVDEWEYDEKQTARCSELIKLFRAVGVREKEAVGLCEKYLGRKADQVLDPTMLLDAKDYDVFVKQSNETFPFLATYLLSIDDNKNKIVSDIAQRLSLDIVHLNSKYEVKDTPLQDRIQRSVEDWLSHIKNARIVVTDSFHAAVFSLIYNVPFIVLLNRERGASRINTLLKTTNQLFRCVNNSSELKDTHFQKPNIVNSKIKKSSLDFLIHSFNESNHQE